MNRKSIIKTILYFIEIVFAYSGIVIRRLTWLRTCFLLLSFLWMFYLNSTESKLIAVSYCIIACLSYPVFLMNVFRNGGWRDQWVQKRDKNTIYNYYEAMIAMLFLHLGVSVVYFNKVFAAHDFSQLLGSQTVVYCIGYVFVSIGLFCKLGAAYATGVDIYYYRDMFLKEKVGDFQVTYLYKYFKNPMYGIGHLHSYGLALLSDSYLAFALSIFNQAAIFTFYYLLEKPFVESFYKKEIEKKV